MNYLVHFLLAGDDEELRLGNLLGDFVKGPVGRFAHAGLTERVRTGIQMHRTSTPSRIAIPRFIAANASSRRSMGSSPA